MSKSENAQQVESSLDESAATVPESKSDKKITTNQNRSRKIISPLMITGWFFIALIIISIGGGYYLWDYVTATKNKIELEVLTTAIGISSLSETYAKSKSNTTESIKTLTVLQSELSNSVEALLSKSTHMRKDWLVSEAEYLIKLAANRLELEGDVKTAITAITNADDRLREAGDPGLLVLRQELSNKLITLKALPIIDISGISIKINSVIQQIDKLPLIIPDPESIKNSQQKATTENKNNLPDNWAEVTSKIVNDLTNLVRIRKHDQKIQPLLTPEQRFYLTQNLKLQLEQARTALLHQQETIFRERLTQSISWINEFFDNSKKSTQSAIEILTNLNKIKLTQETPDLTYALKMFTNFQAGIRLKKKSKVLKQKKTSTKKKAKIKAAPIKTKPAKKKQIESTKNPVSIKKPIKKITTQPETSNPEKSDTKTSDQKAIEKNNNKVILPEQTAPGISL